MSMPLPNRVDQSDRDVYGGSSSCAKAKQRRYVLGPFDSHQFQNEINCLTELAVFINPLTDESIKIVTAF